MRFKRVFSLLAIISLSGLFACDFFPGSMYRTRQTWRTWTVMDATSAPDCMLVGSYTFTQDVRVPQYDVKSSLKLTAEFRQDREFLPTQASVRYDLNGGFLSQINYELNPAGRARTRLQDQPGIFFSTGDVLDAWFCIQDGSLFIHTKVDFRKDMRFDREA